MAAAAAAVALVEALALAVPVAEVTSMLTAAAEVVGLGLAKVITMMSQVITHLPLEVQATAMGVRQ